MDYLWDKLSDWLVEEKEFSLGYIEEINDPNRNRKYVSKYEYHILFRKEQEERLSKVFEKYNILPDDAISEEQIKKLLLENSSYFIVMLLDKMISDNINKDFFKDKVELYDLEKIDDNMVERKPKGTLKLLEEWLLLTYNHPDKQLLIDIFKPLKKVRRERQNPAHRISENVYNLKCTYPD